MKISSVMLASQRLTTALLSLLFIWFGAFPLFIKLSGGKKVAKVLNQGLLLDWFIEESGRYPHMRFWFIGLCLLVGLLALNLIICSWRRFPPGLSLSRQKWLLFLLHLSFGLLVAGHAAGFIWGWRPPPIKAQVNSTIALEQGQLLTVKGISFYDDPGILQKPQRQWTSTDFSFKRNQVEVSLSKNGVEILSGQIATYKPLQKGSLQITLLGFTAPAPGTELPGVRLQVSRAPFAHAVIWLFHCMILLTFVYFMSTKKNNNPEMPA
ncbi:MAG: hypothetical protein JXR80_10670 [Deltaproteobacteria bacterium]|nr:hypothetical protein [Deltaproteobacteria bacterium]